MAYLCKEEFGEQNSAGKGVRFDVRVFAIADGSFLFYDVPTEVLAFVDVKYTIPKRGKIVIYSKTKDAGIAVIKAAITDLLKVETSTCLVIRYNYTTTCHYYVSGRGELFQSGATFEEETGGDYHKDSGAWNKVIDENKEQKSTSMYGAGDYLFGFRAAVYLKTTHRSGNKSRVSYSRPAECDIGEYGNKLNAFVRVGMSSSATELPYTEKVAKMFYMSMWKLCQLAYDLDCFLSDSKKVLDFAAGENLLCGG